MLPKGINFDAASRAYVNAVSAPTVDFRSGGFGFTNGGTGNLIPRLAINTDAPAGSDYYAGLRMDANGAVYGTTTTDVSDVYVGGLRVSVLGQLVFADAAPTAYDQGFGRTVTDALAVQTLAPP